MARYVLVEFDSNDEARRFVENVNQENHAVAGDFKARRVKGVWGKPTVFCECVNPAKGMRPFTRANKSGWWVCAVCRRPTEAWAKNNTHWASALGRNLLPENEDPVPKGWGLLTYPNTNGAAPTPTGDHAPDPALIRKAERRTIKSDARVAHTRRA